MAQLFTNVRPWKVTLALFGFLATLWAWIGAVEAFHINTKGLGGDVTMAIWILYIYMPPLLSFILVLVTIARGITRTDPWLEVTSYAVIAVGAAFFWYWSIARSAFFNLIETISLDKPLLYVGTLAMIGTAVGYGVLTLVRRARDRGRRE